MSLGRILVTLKTMPASRLFVIFSASYPPHMGGVETFTKNAALGLAAKGHDVCVVTNDTNNCGAGFSAEDGFDVLRLPCFPLVNGRLPIPKKNAEWRSLVKELGRRHVDGVLVNARFYPHTLLGVRLAKQWGVTPVVLDHGSAYLSFSNPVLDPIVRLYEHAITARVKSCDPVFYGISAKSVEWLKTFGIEACGVIPNAIDARDYVARASGRDFRSELALSQDAFVVAFVGRLIPEKGIPALVEASNSPEIGNRGIVFVIAGEGPLKDQVKAAEGPTLRYVGRLGQADVAALLKQSNLLCLPSRSEGFSTTLLEAAACGCPALVTDVGGARELIPDESYGTILPSMSGEDVLDSVAALRNNPQVLAGQSENCLRIADRNFSWESTASKLEQAMLLD